MNIMYDMITQKYIIAEKTKSSKEISNFIDKYLKADIRQDDEYSKWRFIYQYTREQISLAVVEEIIKKYVNDEFKNNLVNCYNNVYQNMEIINEKDMLKENTEIIKLNLVMLILYHTIQSSSYIY
jgi:superfamily I DNA/RNA helicase